MYVDIVIQDIRRLTTTAGNPKFKYIIHANIMAHQLAQRPSLISINHTPDHVRSCMDLDVIVT